MSEFSLIDKVANYFERASGCRLHCDPKTEKCKLLLLGRWIGSLQQGDIPLPHLKISDHLDMLGVKLTAKYQTTRRMNGEIFVEIVKKETDE